MNAKLNSTMSHDFLKPVTVQVAAAITWIFSHIKGIHSVLELALTLVALVSFIYAIRLYQTRINNESSQDKYWKDKRNNMNDK